MSAKELESKVRIAYFSDAPYAGGAERYLYLLASSLDRNVFEPVVVVNRNPSLERFKISLERDGIGVHEVSLKLPFSMKGIGGLIRILRTIRPSIFHMNLPGPYSAQFGLVAPIARLSGVRHVVATEHLAMVPPFPKGKVLKCFGMHWVDRVITVSNDNRRHLVGLHKIPEDKIRVVHIGIPDPSTGESAGVRGSLGLGEDSILLVMVGALEERKGHATAFASMANLPDSFHLLVVGEGRMEPEYRKSVGDLGLDARIHFLGRRDDVPSILHEADMFVLSSSMEATPYVIVEAMASGLPVVASDIFGIPELVEDGETGLLFEAGDSAALTEALKSLAADPVRRRVMGEKARRRYEDRFRIELSVGKTVEVYGELVGSGG